jgi:hypothetical protein
MAYHRAYRIDPPLAGRCRAFQKGAVTGMKEARNIHFPRCNANKGVQALGLPRASPIIPRFFCRQILSAVLLLYPERWSSDQQFRIPKAKKYYTSYIEISLAPLKITRFFVSLGLYSIGTTC